MRNTKRVLLLAALLTSLGGACIESPPPASPVADLDMAPDLEDDSDGSEDLRDSGCADDSACPGVCVDGECVECRAAEESGCNTGVCAEGATPAENTCVECVDGADCATGICVENSCVACATSEDCGGEGLTCVDNVCAGCAANTDLCTGSTSKCKTTAELPSGVCVECVDDGDCDEGVCDPGSNQCVTCLPREAEGEEVETGCDEGEICRENTTNSSLNRCIECEESSDCEEGVCNLNTNLCVECLNSQTCGDEVCDTGTGTCVPCLGDNDCPMGVCITGTSNVENVCKPCRQNSECVSPTASLCNANNECVGCAQDGDCSHLSQTPLCVESECVECRPDTENADCSNYVCDPESFSCTNTGVNTTPLLEPCVFNSECALGTSCVRVEFFPDASPPVPLGNFCLPFPNSMNKCPQRFPIEDQRENTDQDVVNVCVMDEGYTSPQAILGYGNSCATSPCNGHGSRCVLSTNGSLGLRCTYDCGTDDDCPTGSTCFSKQCTI